MAKMQVANESQLIHHVGVDKANDDTFTAHNIHPFQAVPPASRLQCLHGEDGREVYGLSLQILFFGIAAHLSPEGRLEVAFSVNDGTYNIDFAVDSFNYDTNTYRSSNDHCSDDVKNPDSAAISDNTYRKLTSYIIKRLREYCETHMYKCAGAGIAESLVHMCPELAARLWLELDIAPLEFKGVEGMHIDEVADAMVRKCIIFFGPNMQLRLQIGFRNQVCVDVGGRCHLATIESYRRSVRTPTWAATLKYVSRMKDKNIKIAFFSSTPQGGGVALMRHALVRFFNVVGVDCKWYVPRPKPEVFRITKNNHNILQGVADPKEHLTPEQRHTVNAWCEDNAKHFWLDAGGPLRKGGADIIVVDDPQMPGIVQIAKENDPNRPVIFRSHIQIRSDLAAQEGTPTAEVWKWLWEKVQGADIFISHPVREFVPKDVDMRKVGYMPATTDWLDGLNKALSDYHSRYYLHLFNEECQRANVPQLEYPARPYIAQICRFDPSKGIPVVLAAYAELRRKYMHDSAKDLIPQLVLAGHGSVDDPDASRVYDETMQLLSTEYNDVREDVITMRIGPVDQILNALLANAHVAMQLSTREGFEIKVSEALHHGVPIVASKAGGIPLQVVDGKNGFLVNAGEHRDAAKHLHSLFTNDAMYKRMRKYAASSVSDELSTVGNALNWMFLASKMISGNAVEPNGKWIHNMARDDIGLPIQEDEIHLPRTKV